MFGFIQNLKDVHIFHVKIIFNFLHETAFKSLSRVKRFDGKIVMLLSDTLIFEQLNSISFNSSKLVKKHEFLLLNTQDFNEKEKSAIKKQIKKKVSYTNLFNILNEYKMKF